MTLQQRLSALITAIGADIKTLYARSVPSGGTTGQVLTKTSNADYATSWSTPGTGGTSINDTTPSGTSTYSSNKIDSQIAASKASILGSASAAYDTLQEIQTFLQNDDTAIAGLLTAVGTRVDTAAAQSFNSTQKQQARTNIDAYGSVEIGNPDTDLAAIYTTAKS